MRFTLLITQLWTASQVQREGAGRTVSKYDGTECNSSYQQVA